MVFICGLSDEQKRRLQRLRRRAVGRVSQRAHMVMLSARGYAVPQIAEIFECGEDVVRDWLHRYEEEGEAGLEDRPRPGRRPKDLLARQIIDAQASQSPQCAGLVQTCWTVRLLAAFLACRFGLALSVSRVRHYLHLEGWRWRRPRLETADKRDPAKVLKLALIARALVDTTARVLYLDECDLHLLPVLRAMWMKGERVRVPTPGTNQRRAFFGALDAQTGRWHYAVRERKLAVHFVAFLDQLVAAYPNESLVLVLDNVRMHDAKKVRHWLAVHQQVRLLWLPKYSAHKHNPVERVWGLMKDAVAANRLSADIDDLVQVACRFFDEMSPRRAIQLAA